MFHWHGITLTVICSQISSGLVRPKPNQALDPGSTNALLRGMAAALTVDMHSDQRRAALISQGFLKKLVGIMWDGQSLLRTSALLLVSELTKLPARDIEKIIENSKCTQEVEWYIVCHSLTWYVANATRAHLTVLLARLADCSPLATLLVACDQAVYNQNFPFAQGSGKLCNQVNEMFTHRYIDMTN